MLCEKCCSEMGIRYGGVIIHNHYPFIWKCKCGHSVVGDHASGV